MSSGPESTCLVLTFPYDPFGQSSFPIARLVKERHPEFGRWIGDSEPKRQTFYLHCPNSTSKISCLCTFHESCRGPDLDESSVPVVLVTIITV